MQEVEPVVGLSADNRSQHNQQIRQEVDQKAEIVGYGLARSVPTEMLWWDLAFMQKMPTCSDFI